MLLLTAEDDFADTVRPRLEALGADLERIFGIATIPGDDANDVSRTFALKRDLARLRDLLEAMPDCRLVVIDPISAYLGSSNADVQSLLHSLTTIARQRGVAMLIVSQLRKKDGAAIYRTMGNVAFIAACRASWAICQDAERENKRLLLPIKTISLPRSRASLAPSKPASIPVRRQSTGRPSPSPNRSTMPSPPPAPPAAPTSNANTQ